MTGAQATPLYLSRLPLNPRSRQVRSEVAHPYEMHRTLMRAFPGESDGGPGRVLFRLEEDRRLESPTILVQSEKEPRWTFLGELNDYLCADVEAPKNIMPAYQNLRDGQILRFRLRANPTKRVAKQDDPMKGKRVELARENEQIDWLIRKGQQREKNVPGGFELVMKEVKNMRGEVRKIPRVDVCPEGKQTGRKREEGHGHLTTHLAVLFGGLLRVTDKGAFLESLICGIGSGKAFGFGLLSVAPCHTPPPSEAL
jgi:CRISPR system Cascade subunit CasE